MLILGTRSIIIHLLIYHFKHKTKIEPNKKYLFFSCQERESGAAKTLGIVVGVFMICWLPFFIWMPLTALSELVTPGWLYDIILWTGYGNSSVNPFIYGLFSIEFKTAMLKERHRFANLLFCCSRDEEERSCCRKREMV